MFTMKHEKIPDSKLLPHMIKDNEVPALIASQDSAEASLSRRQGAAESRDRNRRMTKFITGVATGFAAVTPLGIEAIDYNRNHPVSPPQISRENQAQVFQSRGIDSKGNIVVVNSEGQVRKIPAPPNSLDR
jgi:hypothetical protein